MQSPIDLGQPVVHSMTAMQTAVSEDQTIGEAIESLRSRVITGQVLYIYVVDDADRLVGVLPIRRLLFSSPTARVGAVMVHQSISIRYDRPMREAFEIFSHQRLLALPVVDEERRLLGTIDVQVYSESAADLAEQRQAEDLFQMIGVSVEQARMGGALRGFALRMPWLACNIVGGLSCAAIASLFEATTTEVVALVFFFPLVLTLGEAIAIQAHTIAMPLVDQKPIIWRSVLRRLRIEFGTAGLLGIACGVVAGGAALLFGPPSQRVPMAIILASGAIFGMIASALAGTLVPLVLRMVRLDPKLAAGPVALVVADVVNTLGYLALATMFLSWDVMPRLS
ncbi:MAG: magnesium transporter [Phycisphaeraceae bacterium]|nr:magnesium transporter [Phycisphaeraceae bacterium]